MEILKKEFYGVRFIGIKCDVKKEMDVKNLIEETEKIQWYDSCRIGKCRIGLAHCFINFKENTWHQSFQECDWYKSLRSYLCCQICFNINGQKWENKLVRRWEVIIMI